MHAAVMDFVFAQITARRLFGKDVVEIGGRNINGSIRSLFETATATSYLSVDVAAGPGVDRIADGATADLPAADVVVCCEVLEHAKRAAEIVANARRTLRPSGVFIATMAGAAREPHSAIDGGPLRPLEFYRNVDDAQLVRWCIDAGFVAWEIHTGRDGEDLYIVATVAARAQERAIA